MSRHLYEKDLAQKFCEAVKEAGLRPFLAEKGTYGFYTDAEGSRVVSFQVDLGAVKLSGNYRTSKPLQTGTGWRLVDSWSPDDDLVVILNSNAPDRFTGNAEVRYSTLEQHLETYLNTSHYKEVA